jgi:CheY-like chemotaxis protein
LGKDNKKVLIIDDEAYIRRVIELKLKKRGYQVITARNGEEGLDRFKTHQPDIVITDIKMPKMDGMAFCERTNDLKKERPFLTIIITCSMPGEGWRRLDKMDETLLFEKPFSPSRLLDCIDRYLGNKR